MRRRAGVVAGVLVALLLGGAATAVGEGVHVAFSPAEFTVQPGAEFDVDVQVTEAGAQFNGFRAIVGFDSAALTPVAMSPLALQVGALMSDACGNTFHSFHSGASVDTASDVLLCNGVSITGPGQVYRLRFRASITPQQTNLRFLAGTRFYDAGLFVTPVVSTDAAIGIGMPPAAVDERAPTGPLLAVWPNPARGVVVFRIAAVGTRPESLVVRDVQGRVVWKSAPGSREISWDGRDTLGRRVPGGTYFGTLEAGGRGTTVRFSLLR